MKINVPKTLKQQFEEDNAKWTLVFVLVMIVMNAIVIISTRRAFPDLIELTVGVGIITFAISAYVHSMASEPHLLIRWIGIGSILIVVGADIAQVYGHVTLARELSAIKAGFVDYDDRKAKESKYADEELKRQIQRDKSHAFVLGQQTELEKAQARKLAAAPASARGELARTLVRNTKSGETGGSNSTSDTAVAGPVPLVVPPTKTEAQAKDEWFSFFSWALVICLGASLGPAFLLSYMKRRDSDQNGVRDYIEHIFSTNPALCAQLYPNEYAILCKQREDALAAAQAATQPQPGKA